MVFSVRLADCFDIRDAHLQEGDFTEDKVAVANDLSMGGGSEITGGTWGRARTKKHCRCGKAPKLMR